MKIDNPYRNDFPLIANSECSYLDSGATSQKPSSVIARMEYFYENENANPHRSVYKLSENATLLYEDARKRIYFFIFFGKKFFFLLSEEIASSQDWEHTYFACFCKPKTHKRAKKNPAYTGHSINTA